MLSSLDWYSNFLSLFSLLGLLLNPPWIWLFQKSCLFISAPRIQSSRSMTAGMDHLSFYNLAVIHAVSSILCTTCKLLILMCIYRSPQYIFRLSHTNMHLQVTFIRPFAKFMDMALSKKSSLYLSTKNTILKKYDDRYGSSMFLQARGNPCSFKYPLYNMQAVDTNVHLQVKSIHISIVSH